MCCTCTRKKEREGDVYNGQIHIFIIKCLISWQAVKTKMNSSQKNYFWAEEKEIWKNDCMAFRAHNPKQLNNTQHPATLDSASCWCSRVLMRVLRSTPLCCQRFEPQIKKWHTLNLPSTLQPDNYSFRLRVEGVNRQNQSAVSYDIFAWRRCQTHLLSQALGSQRGVCSVVH